MRSRFPGYYRPTEDQFNELWKTGLIVPDTNILLHLLRYGRDTRREVLDTLGAFRDRLWVPNRVAFEFLRRWRDVDAESRNAFKKLKDDIAREGRTMTSLFDSVSRQQVIDAAAQKAKIDDVVKALCAAVDEAAAKHPSFEESEAIIDEVSELIGDSVGNAPSADQIQQWVQQGTARFAAKIPPGYKDDNAKQGDDRFGDYMIWEEIIAEASRRSMPILFISDDRKEDWIIKSSGKDLGPRPDLMQEFWQRTSQRYYSYPFLAFLKHAQAHIAVKVTDHALEEIREEGQRQAERDAVIEEALKLPALHPEPSPLSAGTAIHTITSGGAPSYADIAASLSIDSATKEALRMATQGGVLGEAAKQLAELQNAWNLASHDSTLAKAAKEVMASVEAWRQVAEGDAFAKAAKDAAASTEVWRQAINSGAFATAVEDLQRTFAVQFEEIVKQTTLTLGTGANLSPLFPMGGNATLKAASPPPSDEGQCPPTNAKPDDLPDQEEDK